MILWTFKLINSVRKAIAGRKHPGQLAWGVALGALLGMIPHGNLLAVALVLFVLMLQVNHAMVALVGVAVTFLAPHLDPTFDALGRWCFAQPQVSDRLALAWEYPLVPWTDLNNTIVMGSFLIGLIAVGPLYIVSYPLFRAWAPATDVAPADAATADAATADAATADAVAGNHDDAGKGSKTARPNDEQLMIDAATEQNLTRFDAGHTNRDGSHVDSHESDGNPAAQTGQPQMSKTADIPAATSINAQDASSEPRPASAAAQYCTSCENSRPPAFTQSAKPNSQPNLASQGPRPTRVAIGSAPSRLVMTTQAMLASRNALSTTAGNSYGSPANDQHKIDEALSYLLRQLRDSKDKDAA